MSNNGNNGYCNFKELFPTKLSFIVFISYMALFINQGLLVTATKDKNNNYNYNTVTAVLFTEVLKLVLASLVYLKDHSFADMFKEIQQNRSVLIRYFIPSSLYCLYNNLTFVNLSSYDPTTYFLLLQFRVVVTGVIFQILFSKTLSRIQWLSLILLTVGCIIKQVGHVKVSKLNEINSQQQKLESEDSEFINIHLILILVQVFASCFAGVYNEYLIKDTDKNSAHIMIQNVFMYIDSIICNIIVLFLSQNFFATDKTSNLSNAFTKESLVQLMTPKVMIVMLNNALIGIVTSIFLKSLNSILKAFASALELMFTGILSWIIFSIPLDVNTVIAIAIVSFSTWLYSRNPVHNPPKPSNNQQIEANKTTV